MLICRLIAPQWLIEENPNLGKVKEGIFSTEEINEYNTIGYNVYYLPNHPSHYTGGIVDGKDIDVFNYVYVDMDLKDGTYASKEEFVALVASAEVLLPSCIVDSGGGVHVYWKVSDLDVMSYLRFQRRLMRLFSTDEAIGQIFQLMRLPNTMNTKLKSTPRPCVELYTDDISYTCEQLDSILPPISLADEDYCQKHYNRTHKLEKTTFIDGKLPPKFGQLIKTNKEVAKLFSSASNDRSKDDFRLGHVMLGHGFTRDEAMNVLYNSAKAMQRAPSHRYSYAENIVDQIWTYEEASPVQKTNTSPTVRDILSRGEAVVKGTRFPCNRLVDDTVHGFRIGQVIGIVGGAGVGKTSLTLNCFLWFCENNPDFHHFFFSLEQTTGDIADRIRTICEGNEALYDKIHLVSNYADDGTFTNYSMTMIGEHITAWEKETGLKVGAVVVDHIGVLAKEIKNSEQDGLIGVCKDMKKVAGTTKTLILMLSQAPREKAGVGDLELDKSAAYGTVMFESYVDYLICLWAPLKRVYTEGAPTIMSIKFAKIRYKKQGRDRIKEDTRYHLFFDPETERLRELTQDEERSAAHFMGRALIARNADKKTDIVQYESRRVTDESIQSATGINDNRDSGRH